MTDTIANEEDTQATTVDPMISAVTSAMPNMDPEKLMKIAAMVQQSQMQAEPEEVGEPQRAIVGVMGVTSEGAEAALRGCMYTLEAIDPGNCDLVVTSNSEGVGELAAKVAGELNWPVTVAEGLMDVEVDVLVMTGTAEQYQEAYDNFEGHKINVPL